MVFKPRKKKLAKIEELEKEMEKELETVAAKEKAKPITPAAPTSALPYGAPKSKYRARKPKN